MNILRFRYAKYLAVIAFIQMAALLFYLNANIVNVGEMGAALPILVVYIGFSVLLLVSIWLKNKLYVRFHFFIFLLLVAWLSTRVVIDLGDAYYLKQVTIATTGGILLFYFVGAFLGMSYHGFSMDTNKILFIKLVLFLCTCLLFWMLYNFSQRLHPRIFYLLDVDGKYQRPGNLLSIYFIVGSYFYLLLSLKNIGGRGVSLTIFIWLVLYALSALMALVGSQLFGSNSATAVILGVCLITLVFILATQKRYIFLNYIQNSLALPWSKKFSRQLALMGLLVFLYFIALLVLVVLVTGFDIASTRLLGFGSFSNTSLTSRIEILLEIGGSQLGYAPFFGNINVAYLTTGDAGRTLHSFFPYVMANLGLVGLTIVLALFFSVFVQLYRESIACKEVNMLAYQTNIISLYSISIFLYLIFFANLATGISWPVLWFTLGFISKPFGFKR